MENGQNVLDQPHEFILQIDKDQQISIPMRFNTDSFAIESKVFELRPPLLAIICFIVIFKLDLV